MTLPELHISAARTEMFVLASALAVLLADLFVPAARRVLLHWASVALLVVAAGLAADGLGESPTIALGGFFAATPLAALLKCGALLAAAGSAAFSGRYLQSRGMMRGEFYALTLLAALGMCVMISAAHFLTLYLGLELMSLCLYAVIALRRDDNAAVESAVKYFVLGALASGLLLYGASILYGAAGDLSFAGVAAAAADSSGANRAALAFGLVFLLAGMAFKLGAAPFHMWLPDVYHGAPAAATLFIAAAPKIAALGMALRVLTEPLGGLQEEWREMLAVLALASLALGNIAAIAQTNLKRMLAYSSIAHAGFMLLGILAGGKGRRGGGGVLCFDIRADCCGGIWSDSRPVVRPRARPAGRHSRPGGAERPAGDCGHAFDVFHGGSAAGCGVLRQIRGPAGAGGVGLCMGRGAGGGGGLVFGCGGVLLFAGGQAGVF